jgi:hypothetical protein
MILSPMMPTGSKCLFIVSMAMLVSVLPRGQAAQTATIAIVEKRQSNWRIVVPPKSSPGVKFAAAELQKYIQQISGCRLPIEEQVRRGPAIVLGLLDEVAAGDQALLPKLNPGWDAYSIAVRKGSWKSPRVVIGAQNGRSAIYGVYDLLEQMGCRWFYPTEDPNDPEVVPHRETVLLKTGSWSVGVAHEAPYLQRQRLVLRNERS